MNENVSNYPIYGMSMLSVAVNQAVAGCSCKVNQAHPGGDVAPIEAGFKEEKGFDMMGGSEGDKNLHKKSRFCGQRLAGDWKLEGLPWTYSMEK
jgi:hypothetical protein